MTPTMIEIDQRTSCSDLSAPREDALGRSSSALPRACDLSRVWTGSLGG